MKYTKSTLLKIDDYPTKYVINQLNHEVKLKHMEHMNIECSAINQTALNEQEKRHFALPYAGNKEGKTLKSMNKFSLQVFPCNFKTCIAYSGTKLSSMFQTKDQTNKGHQHDSGLLCKMAQRTVCRRLHRRNGKASN